MTRPQALQETFEACADVIVQKLQSYYTQSDEYHNQCLQGIVLFQYSKGVNISQINF